MNIRVMNIRDVVATDFEALKRIKPSISNSAFKGRLERQARGEVDFLILEDKNEPVSFVLLKWSGKQTHPEYPDMEDLYTRKEFRGNGYATLLIDECEKRVKERGFKKIGLAVKPVKNSKEGFRQFLLRTLDRDVLLNKRRMEERKALAENYRVPVEAMMDVSATYAGIAERIIGKPLQRSERAEEEILDSLVGYGLIE